jgi:type II secretion system protein N
MKFAELYERYQGKLAYAGYTAFYLAAFGGCFFMTFPYRVLRDRVVLDFAKEQRKAPHPKSLSIEALGPAWGGVRATGVKLVTPGEKANEKPTALAVTEVVLKPSLAAALVGATDVSFSAQVFGGSAEGRIVSSKDERSILVKLARIDLKQSEGASASIGLPVEGFVDGSLRLELPEGKGAKANGVAQFEITELAFGDGKAKFRDQLAMPKLTVGTLVFNAEAKDGSLKMRPSTSRARGASR